VNRDGASLPRQARPEDYDAVAAVADGWWGRPVLASPPRLFLDHFHRSSLVIEGPGGPTPVPGYNGPGPDLVVFERAL
jgi:hypothetical protein